MQQKNLERALERRAKGDGAVVSRNLKAASSTIPDV